MKQRLCLHGLEVKHRAQLLDIAKRVLPDSVAKYSVKEKYFNDNDMYKCSVTRFSPKKQKQCRLLCLWGALLVSDTMQQIADIILEYDSEDAQAAGAVQRLLRRILAGRIKFVLAEPDLSLRLDLLRGCYRLQKLDAYDANDAMSALCCHLPCQLYDVSRLWSEIDKRGALRPLLRQLRVKLRRLRSLLTLLKPLLPEEEAAFWQGVLKARTNLLGDVREYDVLLMNCEKINGYALEEKPDAVPALYAVLARLRDGAAAKLRKNLRLNKLTLELALLQLCLYSAPQQEEERRLEQFLRRRFAAWYERLVAAPERYAALPPMERLHCIRIKVKRFRYALQSVPELPASPRLLRSLKYLQDMLGVLHDDYVNRSLLEQLLQENAQLAGLRCEAALFHGWGQARADAALEQLPAQWDSFCSLLAEWKEENL